ncbi:cytochrome-c peroxidase [Thioalkalivibrio sp. ALE23]|uniref:cytochrome-c peroxidase n=1 Tax=Thioalkalivibrio sp. ALE23 TaxID=1265495 RepID=UPI00037E1AD3|nr:cytochrome c peroxidase [Thioalkalivibrio sp. ALE23]
MQKKRIFRGLLVSACTAVALGLSAPTFAGDYDQYRDMFEPLPALPPIPADNSLTDEKVELGKFLFFEPRISSSGVISCATCHNPALGWADRIPRAVGHAGQVGERNSPTVLNSGFFEAQFWDGREDDLEGQALGPIQDAVEMAMPLEEAIARLEDFPEYIEMFDAAYPDYDGDNVVNTDHVAKALASFQRTLNTPNSDLDRWLVGDDDAMSEQQKRGMALFADNGCVACHRGPALTDSNFHQIQVPGSEDKGRYLVTGEERDKYAFKTPTLRNVALTYPYMNNGETETLKEAIEIMGQEMLDTDFTEDELEDIEAFMHALTGEMPDVTIPALP